jgi:predicted nucleic acid-binding protein
MPAGERLLVDTNVLLEATDERGNHHGDARRLIESAAHLVLTAQVIREYLAVTTRPADANGLGTDTADALANVREFRRRIRLLPEEEGGGHYADASSRRSQRVWPAPDPAASTPSDPALRGEKA